MKNTLYRTAVVSLSLVVLAEGSALAVGPKRPAVPAPGGYATVAQADKLASCPLERTPPSLKAALGELVARVKTSVEHAKEVRTECAALEKELETEADGQDVGEEDDDDSSPSEAPKQGKINKAVRRASSVRAALATTGKILGEGCVSGSTDRIGIVRSIGQVATLGGTLAGGWPGMIAAAGGEILSLIGGVLSQDPVKEALDAFRDYEKTASDTAFLCLYREMRTTDALLFVSPDEPIIHGVDLNFASGVSKTTLESFNKLRTDDPTSVAEVVYLDALTSRSAKPVETLEALTTLCREPEIAGNKLRAGPQHPAGATSASQALHAACERLSHFDLPKSDEEEAFVQSAAADITTLVRYRTHLKADSESEIGKAAATIASMRYFESLGKSFEAYTAPSGNQLRLSYRALTRRLGNSLGRDAFRTLLRKNADALQSNGPQRDRAFLAMLDACQAFDPTLAFLATPGDSDDRFLPDWARACVGAKAPLCRQAARAGVDTWLERYPDYKDYYKSLCPDGASARTGD